MQFSGLQVLSFVTLLLGTAAVVVSIATDYWSHYGISLGDAFESSEHRGLWKACAGASLAGLKAGKCYNRFNMEMKDDGSVNMTENGITKWELACLGLMCGSALLGVLSLLFSPCCCNRCGCFLTLIVLLAALCCTAGVGLYAYQLKVGNAKVFNLGGIATVKVNSSAQDKFGWSFWTAVGGGAFQLFATLGFGVSRARQHSYSHTI